MRQFTQAFNKSYKRLVSEQAADKPMRFYIFLLIVPVETVFSQRRKEPNCKKADAYKKKYQGYGCPIWEVGTMKGSRTVEEMLEPYIDKEELSMIISSDLKQVACAKTRGENITEACDVKKFDHKYGQSRDRNLPQLAREIYGVLKADSKEKNGKRQFNIGCYPTYPNGATCFITFTPRKLHQRKKAKTNEKSRDQRVQTQEEGCHQLAPTAGKETSQPGGLGEEVKRVKEEQSESLSVESPNKEELPGQRLDDPREEKESRDPSEEKLVKEEHESLPGSPEQSPLDGSLNEGRQQQSNVSTEEGGASHPLSIAVDKPSQSDLPEMDETREHGLLSGANGQRGSDPLVSEQLQASSA